MLTYPTSEVIGLTRSYFSPLSALGYGMGRIVALPNDGLIFATTTTGTKGKIWNFLELPESCRGNWKNVIFGNNLWVAVNSSLDGSNNPNIGTALYSQDGLNWNISNIGGYGWNDIAFGNGIFVAVGEGVPANRAISSDGINWSTGNLLNFGKWNSITFGDGQFVAVSRFSNDNILIASSADGENWSPVIDNFSLYQKNQWNDILFDNNGIFTTTAYGGNISGKFAFSFDNASSWYGRDIGNRHFEGNKLGIDNDDSIIMLPHTGNNIIITDSFGSSFSEAELLNFDKTLLKTDFKWTNFLSNIPVINNLMIGYSMSESKLFALSKNDYMCSLSGDNNLFINLRRTGSELSCANNFWISGVSSNARLTGSFLNLIGPKNTLNPEYLNYFVISSEGQIGNFIDGESVLYRGNKYNSLTCLESTEEVSPYKDGFRNNKYYTIKVLNSRSQWGTSQIAIGTDCALVYPQTVLEDSSFTLIYDSGAPCTLLRWGDGDNIKWSNSFNGIGLSKCYDANYNFTGQVYWPENIGIIYISFDEATKKLAPPAEIDESHIRIKMAQFYIDLNTGTYYKFIENFIGYGNTNYYLNGLGSGIISNPTGWQPAISFISGVVTGTTDSVGKFTIDEMSLNENNPTILEQIVDGVPTISYLDVPCTGDCIENKLIPGQIYLNYITGYTFASNVIQFNMSTIEIGNNFSVYFYNTNNSPDYFTYTPSPQTISQFSGINDLILKINSGNYNFSGLLLDANSIKLISKISGSYGRFLLNKSINTDLSLDGGILINNRYSVDGIDLRPSVNYISGKFNSIGDNTYEFENSGYYTQFLNITGDLIFSSSGSGVVWTNNFDKTWTIITGIKYNSEETIQTGKIYYDNILNQYSGRTLITSGAGELIQYTGLNIFFERSNPYNVTGNIAAYIIDDGVNIYYSGNLQDF